MVDFLLLHIGDRTLFVFNLADAALTLGPAILILVYLWPGKGDAGGAVARVEGSIGCNRVSIRVCPFAAVSTAATLPEQVLLDIRHRGAGEVLVDLGDDRVR